MAGATKPSTSSTAYADAINVDTSTGLDFPYFGALPWTVNILPRYNNKIINLECVVCL